MRGEARHLPACIVLVNDVALGGAHQLRLGLLHRFDGGVAVALFDRRFDEANRTAHLGAAGFVDRGATGNLASRLLGGGGIGHGLFASFGGAPLKWPGWSCSTFRPMRL